MPSSTNVVNFSLRQNKAIERAIVFDGAQDIFRNLQVVNPVYIGFGSIWFADFQLAHRQLGITDMISIEGDPLTFERAQFNSPFRTVDVVHGRSDVVLSGLLARPSISGRPTMAWLDYDEILDKTKLDELIGLAGTLPPDSLLITTFSVRANAYAKVRQRSESLADLFGDTYDELDLDLGEQANFTRVIGYNLERSLLSSASQAGRASRGYPAFLLPYQDATPMLTIGIYLPSGPKAPAVATLLASPEWNGRTADSIATPHLTEKEAAALQTALPSNLPLSRADVKALGFDLDESSIASFCKYYTQYPSFAQVAR